MVWHDHGALTYYINIPKELECIVKLGKGNCMSNIKLVLKKGYQRGYQELPINECEPYIRQAEQQGIIYIANNIIIYLEHPTARMLKDHWDGEDEPESDWQTLYGVDQHCRYYMTCWVGRQLA